MAESHDFLPARPVTTFDKSSRQESRRRSYIFVMRLRMRFLPPGLFLLTWACCAGLRADPGDIEGARDYTGFPRLPGFVITDYDEDNPEEADFPVARPIALDAGHVDTVHVTGHRYIIRYELGAGHDTLTMLETQHCYEELAAINDFTVEKTGAVGDVSETFYRRKNGHDTWLRVEPSATVNVLTIVESDDPAPPPPVVVETLAAKPVEKVEGEDPIYGVLVKNGRVVLPLSFVPGKPDLEGNATPVIERVAAMLNRHPELSVRIVGHTDSSGDAQDNLRLSAARAETVKARLVTAQVDENRVEAVGLGGSEPVADSDTAEGREKNRRIELVIGKGPIPAPASVIN